MTTVVVKLGGAVAGDSADAILALAQRHRVCVVHGAGLQISAEMSRLAIPREFVEGNRVTSVEGLEVVRRCLAAVNADVCAALGKLAVPLFGDEISLRATPMPELGLVGEALPSRPQAVVDALAAGRIPVVSPLASGPLNVNADDAASALAIGLGAERLSFLTDVPGLLLGGAVARSIAASEAEHLLETGVLVGGIVPKLRAAIAAARGGVEAEIGTTAVVA
ncbi:MAG: acetylglutamate kinase [Gaiellaceae bacterium MAG52_C11]|nr:acetylglutamate kinase [Candidatus Gaiellasilicea maunaloa]